MAGGLKKKLVLLGDSGSGKTCLCSVFTNGHFPEDNHSIVFLHVHSAQIVVDGKQVQLCIWDTVGLEDYEKQRSCIYSQFHAIIMCFSVDNPASLQNIPELWTPEVRHFHPKVPIVLVACKKDLRDTPLISTQKGLTAVSYLEGKEMANRIGARAYIECSAITKENVKEVFEIATREAGGIRDQPPKQPKGRCTLL